LTTKAKKLLKNDYFQTVFVVALIVSIVIGFWYGSQLVMNTEIPPALAVVSGSMCIPYDGACDGWTHPFDRTLHVGDIIIIQGVDIQDLKTDYPNSDIIVFHRPDNPDELIVHRIVDVTIIDGKRYFFTKGDGNSAPDTWPTIPKTWEYDPWNNGNADIPQGAVSEDLIVGKVVMRVPWVGYIAIFMHDNLGINNEFIIIPIIIILATLLIIVEFAEPLLRRKNKTVEQKSIAD
jgi:signal peptidase I